MKGYLSMKQDLWLANSSLLLMFILSLGVYNLLQQEPPVWVGKKRLSSEEVEKKATLTESGAWEKIYQDDIFGTYVAQEVKEIKQALITPIPELKQPVLPPAPEIKKQEFIPPLNITLRGIIAGADEMRNVVMIADETGKEGMYHLGEKIKDAQIIKIAPNRSVLLRANGQQETFYLRKDDLPDEQNIVEKWKHIVHKLDDQSYMVDPIEFAKEVETLGNFIDRIAVIGAAYAGGKPIGIRIGKIASHDLAQTLGLMDDDIIISINDLNVADENDRVKAYDLIVKEPMGSVIKVGIKRANKDVFFSYKLAKIERPRKSIFPGVKLAQPQTPQGVPGQPEEGFKMNRLQQREQAIRDFARQQNDEQRQQSMLEIRRRILEGLQQRIQNNRQ